MSLIINVLHVFIIIYYVCLSLFIIRYMCVACLALTFSFLKKRVMEKSKELRLNNLIMFKLPILLFVYIYIYTYIYI